MFVGVLRLVLHLPEPGLAQVEAAPGPLGHRPGEGEVQRLIAEVAENDLWQRSVMGVAAVGNDHGFVNELLDKVADFVASMHGGQILMTGRDLEIVPYGDELGEGACAPGRGDARGRRERRAAASRPRPRPRRDRGRGGGGGP